ncbi:hypothetical protein [Clostridium thermobutyricum]|uniref:hypothetical protein n=1 Tax=Clostridium thermobutyricum TaxID=29372 RepID=UPI0018A92C33|nr:hypothetical protein [Clostridium thermobutyricum]
MTDKEFLKELRSLISAQRSHLERIKSESEYMTNILKERLKRSEEMLDKLEQDYFCIHPSTNLDNIKKFDEDGNLIKKEKTTTEQVEEGLLKIFNELIENGEYNIGHCDFDNEKFSTSLCQIADRLLQIQSDRKLSEEYYKNCTID